MGRKKRGAKTASIVGRKLKSQKQENQNVEESALQNFTPTESEESCGSGTSKSCDTPMEIEKSTINVPAPPKKLGKFRFLTEETMKNEINVAGSELQLETVEIDQNIEIMTVNPDNLINELEAVEISDSIQETETYQDITICSEEIYQEEIIEDFTETVIDSTFENQEPEIPLPEESDEVESCSTFYQSFNNQEQIISNENSNDTTTKVEREHEFISEPILELNHDLKPPETETTVSKKSDSNLSNSNSTTVRRSSRIKSISVLKQRSKGHGLVKSDKDRKEKLIKPTKSISFDLESIAENSNSNISLSDKIVTPTVSPTFAVPLIGGDLDQKPVKVKSRWRRSSELEMGGSSPLTISSHQSSPQISLETENQIVASVQKVDSPVYDEAIENRLRQFQILQENQYLTERTSCKEAKKMVCDCFLTKEEIERGEFGCGEDCLNRLLMIECGSQCVVGDRCTNKRFQNLQYAPCEVFKTEKKGFGIRALADIPFGEFILEYVGEVLDPDEFDKRAKDYSKDKNIHYYFMALKADAVIDATVKGNISRFINHSCDPNAETQKWTVNGELRIGFFSKRTILANEEITFDYQFQRYGKEAQKCYCESSNCRGWIGEEPREDNDEDYEEDSEREEDEGEENDVKESDNTEDIKEPKTVVKKQVRKRRQLKKQRKDIFEDLDLDEEIRMLSRTGLKNQAHTLKLSRLMVRAKDVGPRMQLLKLLREGDLPCRRLFLDYHGLRLIYGWMCDATIMTDEDNTNHSFRIEILQTLASLPIPNKTMLKDSKVLSTVLNWSIGNKTEITSPEDSESNSPQIDPVPEPQKEMEIVHQKIEENSNEDFTADVKIDLSKPNISWEDSITGNVMFEEINNQDLKTNQEKNEMKEEIKEEKVEMEEENENIKIINDLTSKLLNDWSVLKEVFRIPKKERIEQMKEHEREADRDYKAGLVLEKDDTRDARYTSKIDRYRINEKDKRKHKEQIEHERSNIKKIRIDDRIQDKINTMFPKLSKFERRQLFALQVAQEEGRRRKQEQEKEMWRMHEQRCMVGADPRLSNIEVNQGYQCFWNPTTGQWQSPYPPPPGQQPTMYAPPVVQNHPQHMMMMPPLPGNPNQNRPMVSPVYQVSAAKEEVVFAGPIPPPVKLPPKWKSGRDQYGRPYYYHIKIRISQWEPPEFPPPAEEPNDIDDSTSSSDTSSLSSDSLTDSDEDTEFTDTKLLLEIKSKLKKNESGISDKGDISISSPLNKNIKLDFESKVSENAKRKREGLVQEIIISPRSEQDKLAKKLELKKYKETKEKLKKQKQMLEQTKKKLKTKFNKSNILKSSKKHKLAKSIKIKNIDELKLDEEAIKRKKEHFRSSMAINMVQYLNPYRKPECKIGRIINTEDFKHLARKLTHFVMVKELKHCQSIEDLVCNESVKAKAKDFVRKYMAKFGEFYKRPKDEVD